MIDQPLTFHGLRHSFASLALEAGVPLLAEPGRTYKGVCTREGEVPDQGSGDQGVSDDGVEDVGVAGESWDIACLPQDHKWCMGGNVYWFDSCGNQGSLAQTCGCGCTFGECNCCPSCPACRTSAVSDGCGGTCAANCSGTCSGTTCCVPQDHKECVGGNVYWFDSCGNQGSLAQTCGCGCTGSACDCCPSWSCGGWSACTCGNVQTRTCTDLNGCGTTAGKPAESQTCVHCGNGVCDCGETSATCAKDCPTFNCPTGYVPVPAGTFTMGSPENEPGHDSDETQHEVTISKGFCLKETEVTQGEWKTVMGNNPSSFSSCGDDCPVERVSWWDALAYCNKLSSNEGLQQCYGLTGCSGTPGTSGYGCTGVTFVGLSCSGYRLPTESEWEYAARAGTPTATYNGTEPKADECGYCGTSKVLDPIAWWCGNNTPYGTKPVKGKQANAWGLYDMLGNVWEWVEDCWHWGYDGDGDGKVQTPGKDHPTDGTAWQDGCSAGSYRVRRGGSWGNFAGVARAAALLCVPANEPTAIQTQGPAPAPSVPKPEPSHDHESAPPDSRISPRQIGYLYALGRQAGLSRDQVSRRAVDLHGGTPEHLSRAEASALIEALRKETTS